LRRLLSAIAGLTFNQWVTLISLLVLLNLVVMGGLFWVITAEVVPADVSFSQVILAQAPATRTPYPTFTVAPPGLQPLYPTLILPPSPTNTRVPTWTPSITPTPPPTATPTTTPTPTNMPVVAQARVRPPTSTPTPTLTPTPNVDFIATIRQLTPCENQGKHHIFIYVFDQQGNGIAGAKIKVSWPSGEAIVETGTKIEGPGLTDFAMFKGSYHVELLGFVSEVVGPITPDIPKDELCKENNNPVGNSLYHYSYEVIFRKAR